MPATKPPDPLIDFESGLAARGFGLSRVIFTDVFAMKATLLPLLDKKVFRADAKGRTVGYAMSVKLYEDLTHRRAGDLQSVYSAQELGSFASTCFVAVRNSSRGIVYLPASAAGNLKLPASLRPANENDRRPLPSPHPKGRGKLARMWAGWMTQLAPFERVFEPAAVEFARLTVSDLLQMKNHVGNLIADRAVRVHSSTSFLGYLMGRDTLRAAMGVDALDLPTIEWRDVRSDAPGRTAGAIRDTDLVFLFALAVDGFTNAKSPPRPRSAAQPRLDP